MEERKRKGGYQGERRVRGWTKEGVRVLVALGHGHKCTCSFFFSPSIASLVFGDSGECDHVNNLCCCASW